MKKAFILYGLKTQNVHEPKFKFAILDSAVDFRKEILHKEVLFPGCVYNNPKDISDLLKKAKSAAKEQQLDIIYAMNGFYVSQSHNVISPIEPIEDEVIRNLIDEHFGIFDKIPEINSPMEASVS